jgi:hypothetical protein
MRFAIRWVAALAVPAMLLAGPSAWAQKKKPNPDKDKDADAPAEKAEKMIRAGVLVGKVAAVYEDKRKIRLQVVVPKLNPGAINSIAQAQMQMARARSVVAMIQAQQALARAQASLYTAGHQDVELQVLDDVVVRTARPREEFDEKGKVKKLTRAELKELKGPDPKLPGFKAEFGDVSADQFIQVTLVRKKPTGPAPKPVPRKGKKAKDGDAEAAADLLADHLPQVSMIMILLDPPPAK